MTTEEIFESENPGAVLHGDQCNGRAVVLPNQGDRQGNVSEDVILEAQENGTQNDSQLMEILDHVQHCPAVFRSQQIGDPELTAYDKRQIAKDLFHKNPVHFLLRFGSYLNESHLTYISSVSKDSYEVQYYVKQFKSSLSDKSKKIARRNRRFEALKRLEADGAYFSEVEMEKREPLLYDQLVGQFLSEKEKLQKSKEAAPKQIPTFSHFLIEKMERDNVDELKRSQEEAEECLRNDSSSEDETMEESVTKRWGDDWIDAEKEELRKKQKKPKKIKKVHLSITEKALLLSEFRTLMHTKFLNGMDTEFDYNTVDSNPEYDCLEVRSQDEEEKYFDEETSDDVLCTDTGIEDY